MGQNVKGRSELCPLPPGPMKDLTLYSRPNPILVAVSLALILTTAGLAYYWMRPPPFIPLQLIPHAAIAIDGDADFAATALLEGWPGDGSPENPYLIDGLDIDFGDGEGHCIMISNTRVSFTISNCNLTGANHAADWEPIMWSPGADEEPPRHEMNKGAGIHLHNVSNGELVSNTCNKNSIGIDLFYADSNTVIDNTCTNNGHGIVLWGSNSNTVTNNTCSSNTEGGISLYVSTHSTLTNNNCTNNRIGIYLYTYWAGMPWDSKSNSVTNNTCNKNSIGIDLLYAESSAIANNTCNNNDIGINLEKSHSNTVSDNTCNNNRIGVYIDDGSESNTVENNTFSGNTEHDIVGEYTAIYEEPVFDELAHQDYVVEQFVWFLAGVGMILVTSVVAFVKFRRMGI